MKPSEPGFAFGVISKGEFVYRGGFGLANLKSGRLNNGKPLDYARGLGVEEEGGYTLISHSGSYVGFRAEMMRWVEARLSVIVLANRDDLDVSEIARRVALYFLPNEGKPDLSGEPVFDSIEN